MDLCKDGSAPSSLNDQHYNLLGALTFPDMLVCYATFRGKCTFMQFLADLNGV